MTTRRTMTDEAAERMAGQTTLPGSFSDGVMGVGDEATVDLMELLVMFLGEWRIGLAVAVLVMLAGTAYTYYVPPQFVAMAVILPKQNFAESNSLTTLFGGHKPEILYTGLLRSRSVTDNVIRDMNLLPPGSTKGWEDMRNFLQANLGVTLGADGLLRLTMRSVDAKMAMKLTNAFLNGLNEQQQTMAMTQTVQNRKFFELQLAQEKKDLLQAEQDLVELQKKTGIIEAGTQTATGLGEIAGVRNSITNLEVQLAALLQSETEDNGQVKTLRSQIAKLQSQERTYEANGANAPGSPTAAGRMPTANLEFERAQRAVRIHEQLLSAVSGQYQNAQMVEASSSDVFQVVDYAIEPERKAYPPRDSWLVDSALFGMVLGGFAMVFVLVKRRVQADVDYQRHVKTIKQNFRMRRRTTA